MLPSLHLIRWWVQKFLSKYRGFRADGRLPIDFFGVKNGIETLFCLEEKYAHRNQYQGEQTGRRTRLGIRESRKVFTSKRIKRSSVQSNKHFQGDRLQRNRNKKGDRDKRNAKGCSAGIRGLSRNLKKSQGQRSCLWDREENYHQLPPPIRKDQWWVY